VAEVSLGQIAGFGAESYVLALHALKNVLSKGRLFPSLFITPYEAEGCPWEEKNSRVSRYQYRKCQYLSGFKGSSGAVLITKEKNVFITDFRYQEEVGRNGGIPWNSPSKRATG